ncbi:MAG: hypothetical protein LIP16_05835 [Clostridium sp.]|nr:hypothetical protein [Clostridium sp.]
MADKVMIIGYGSTGKYVLDMLTRLPELRDCRYTIVSRTAKEEAEKRINLTLVSAGIFGLYPKVTYIACDINDTEGLSRILAFEEPDVIAYTGRYMKGFKYGEFSYPNHMGYGVWTPMAAVLAWKVMKAVSRSQVNARVINTSYGDAVSPLLAARGLAPYTSAGNLNHLIPRIARAYEALSGEPAGSADVTFAGSHYANTYISKEGTAKGSPYLLNIRGSKDISDEAVFKKCAIPTASGQDRNIMIASDVVMLVRLLLDKSGAEHKIHAPGPFGYIGGYPLLFKNGEMKVDETCFTLDEMRAVNESSLRCDGIDKLDENGIHFTKEAVDKMKAVFGIDYPKTVALEDCERFAAQIAETIGGFYAAAN